MIGGTPRLSVIIPTLNEQGPVGKLLDDLSGLRRAGHELILVDGGSQDTTTTIAEPLVDRLLSAPPGRAAQMNAGAQIANGDILWFLHADSGVSHKAAPAILAACATGHSWGRFDIRLSGPQRLLRVIETMMNLRSRISGIATGDQGIFVTRALFTEVGGFPEISLMEDVALCKALRRRAVAYCIRRPRLVTSSRRWESQGILRTILLMWRLRLAYALGASPERLARHYR